MTCTFLPMMIIFVVFALAIVVTMFVSSLQPAHRPRCDQVKWVVEYHNDSFVIPKYKIYYTGDKKVIKRIEIMTNASDSKTLLLIPLDGNPNPTEKNIVYQNCILMWPRADYYYPPVEYRIQSGGKYYTKPPLPYTYVYTFALTKTMTFCILMGTLPFFCRPSYH